MSARNNALTVHSHFEEGTLTEGAAETVIREAVDNVICYGGTLTITVESPE